MVLAQPIRNIVAHVALHSDLLAATRRLRHAGPGRELLAELLGDFLQIEPKGLQARNLGHVLALVPLDALDDYLGCCAFLRLSCLGRLGFGGFLLRVFLRPLLSVDGEGGEARGGSVGGVELGVEGRVVGLEPLGALLGRAAVFTVL